MINASSDSIRTCTVEGPEKQHEPMIMKWLFSSETNTSGAQEHASQDADPKTLSDEEGNMSKHAQEDEPDWGADEETDIESNNDQQTGEDLESPDSKDELISIGFALAKSLAFLPEFSLPENSRDRFNSDSMDHMCNARKEEGI